MLILFYCSLPVVTALIGWITNYIAVKMIFRPRREMRLLGVRFIGLIPKRKAGLAEKIAETIEKELISHRDIQKIVQSEEFHLQTSQVIKKRIREFIDGKCADNPLLAMFMTSDVAGRLTDMLMDEFNKEIPGVIDSLFQTIEKKVDFREIIKEKINSFDLNRFESIVYSIASKELKAIEIFGGVLGFIVGIIQLLFVLIGNACS